MTEWSARALPRLRRDLADAYDATADRVGALVARSPMSSLTASASELVEHHQALARLTRGAELYWVTADMGALALDASHDVPGFTMADLPGTNGLIAFGAPLPASQTPPLWLEGGTPWSEPRRTKAAPPSHGGWGRFALGVGYKQVALICTPAGGTVESVLAMAPVAPIAHPVTNRLPSVPNAMLAIEFASWPLQALGAGVAIRSGGSLGSGRSGWALGADVALKAGAALRSHRPGWPLRPRYGIGLVDPRPRSCALRAR